MTAEITTPAISGNPLEVNDQKAIEAIRGHAKDIVDGRKRGRYPLFIIGAGVSQPAGIPLLSEMVNQIKELAHDKKVDQVNELCEQSLRTRSRSDVAILFNALQEAKPSDPTGGLWNQFCENLIRVKTGGQKGGLLNTKPTDTHNFLAKMCLDWQAKCLSVNFDGLTRKGIDNLIEARGQKNEKKCVILDSQKKIWTFWGREPQEPSSQGLVSVVKLRGDIFYARCQTSGCPLEKEETPVYSLSLLSEKADSDDPQNVLRCSECGQTNKLQIAFPGSYEKESESEEILAGLGRYVVPSLSMVFILGMSGEWDRSLVDFIFHAARCQDVPIVDVRLDPGPGNSHYIRDIWRTNFTDSIRYFPYYGKADNFSQIIDESLQSEKTKKEGAFPKHHTSIKFLGVDVKPDLIWTDKPKRSGDLASIIANQQEFQDLECYSQLGLKTFWWGNKDALADHNRYRHSKGAMEVATQWYDFFQMRGFLRPLGMQDEEIEKEKEWLKISMLLHDFGHLPFSHLFEEIFDELHWMPDEGGGKPWHEVLTKKNIHDLLNKPGSTVNGEHHSIIEGIEDLGYEIQDITNLISGSSGKPYLDAIVNSPVDADKIDYLFRDTKNLCFGSSLSVNPDTWLSDFLEDQELSPEGFIRLNGLAALRMLELLKTRRKLYCEFYLAPELRMMERMTLHVLITYLAHYISSRLLVELEKEKQEKNGKPFGGDHGSIKVRLARNHILEEYRMLLRDEKKAEERESALIEKIFQKLEQKNQEDKGGIDPSAFNTLKNISEHLKDFKNQGTDQTFGKSVRDLYKKLHVAGPYYAKEHNEGKLREIVRKLTLLYQGSILFDVAKSPKFLAGSKARKFKLAEASKMSTYGETFLVPPSNPWNWNFKSRALSPLSGIDFGELKNRYVQVLLFDIIGNSSKASHVHQQFLRACKSEEIQLDEYAPIV